MDGLIGHLGDDMLVIPEDDDFVQYEWEVELDRENGFYQLLSDSEDAWDGETDDYKEKT